MKRSLAWAILLILVAAAIYVIACNKPAPPDAQIIQTVRLHELRKLALKGTAAMYSGWTLDDTTEVTTLYGNETKACTVDISGEVLLVKYQIVNYDNKLVFGWELQPSMSAAGCMMDFASFRPKDEKEGHDE